MLATVASTWGSSPRPVGSIMILTNAGHSVGSVSGGCIEEELLATISTNFPKSSQIIEYDTETSRNLPCGGRLLLILEPLNLIQDINGLTNSLDRGEKIKRVINISKNDAFWAMDDDVNVSSSSDEIFTIKYDSLWRLLVIGSGDLSRSVSLFGQMLDYDVQACEPRVDFRNSWDLNSIALSSDFPDDFIRKMECNEKTAIVALTHDPKIDDLAMIEALETNAFYIGALGSTRTSKKRSERLSEHFGFGKELIKKIRAPIGIDLGTRKVNEIALSIMTDITASRNSIRIDTTRE